MNTPIFANNLYTIEPYLDLPTESISGTSWLPPLANTTRDDELFFVNTKGKVYRSKGQEVTSSPFIDFSSQLPSKKNALFTAITLHPNFHLFDQVGANVIYTAHVEPHNKSITKRILSDDIIKEHHSHDAIITEWKLSNINNDRVSISHQREVMRIATTSIDINISQLSFNPFLKLWSDDFGLLYISLKNDNAFKNSALYSGSILRIKPNKFGLRNYTIPKNNPFIEVSNIANEAVLIGAQNINQFTWSKKTKKQLILTHKYNDEQLISISLLGSNYISNTPENIIYKNQTQNVLLSNIYYNDRALRTLWNKLILLTKSNEQWQISSINVDITPAPQAPNIELNIDTKTTPFSDQLSIIFPRENELLLWDKLQTIIYKVVATNAIQNTIEAAPSPDEKNKSNTAYYIIALSILVFITLFFIKNKYNQVFTKTKALLRTNLARFEFDINSNDILLFKRHGSDVDTTISIENITTSEIYLNDTLLNQVTHQVDDEFDEIKESTLRKNFEQEHRDKMVNDKVRKISLKLTTIKAEEFIICAYLREGNQRFTKEKYHTVIDQIIEWQWFLSSKINPENTPDRTTKTKKVITPKAVMTPLETIKTTDKNTIKNSAHTVDNVGPKNANGKVDTKLIDALNKLVLLKEQGYLSEDEFTLAKNNLLEGL